jgi:hypothetical protein
MPTLIGPDGRAFPLADGALVGRRGDDGGEPDVDLSVFERARTVSRRHARIQRRDGGWYLRVEERTTNSTKVAGRSLGPGEEAPLGDGDEIVFGGVSVLFRGDSDPDMTIIGRGQANAELRADGHSFPLVAPEGRKLRLGRHSTDGTYKPEIDLSDVEGSISVSHLTGHIYHHSGEWRLQLSKTTNRTFISGNAIEPGEEVKLNDGDWIQLGRVRVTFHEVIAPKAVANELLMVTVSPKELTIEAGGQQQASINVVNASGHVEQLDIELSGVPSDWYTLSLPDGTRDRSLHLQLLNTADPTQPIPGAAAQASAIFTTPRVPESRAGVYPISISATTRGANRIQRVELAQLRVLPFEGLTFTTGPDQIKGSRGTYTADIQNTGNIDVTADVRVTGDGIVAEPAQQQLQLSNGATKRLPLKVRPRRRHWFGLEKTYGFDVTAIAASQRGSARPTLAVPPIVPHWIQFIFGKAYSMFSPIAIPAFTLALMVGIAYFLLRPPDIREFRAENGAVAAGTTTQLKWRLDRAAGASIEPALAEKLDVPEGTLDVSPQARTEYTITARNLFGISSSAKTVVEVLKIASFTATPNQLTREREEVTLKWDTQGAVGVKIEPADEIKDPKPSGEAKVHPTTATTYKLTATGFGAITSEAQTTVAIGTPVIKRFEMISPPAGTRIFPGDVIQLNWQADGLSSATLSADKGDVVPGQKQLDVSSGPPVVVRPSAVGDVTYTLNATNAAGTTQMTTRISVAPLSILQFDVDPPAVTTGLPTKLKWRVEGANNTTSITLEPGIGRVEGTGERSITPTESTEFTLKVVGADGAPLEAHTGITVREPNPVINVFTAVPSSVTFGEQVRLTWNAANAQQIEIRTANGIVLRRATDPEGTMVVSPTEPTTYIIEARNGSGSATKDVSVDVRPPPTPVPPPPAPPPAT